MSGIETTSAGGYSRVELVMELPSDEEREAGLSNSSPCIAMPESHINDQADSDGSEEVKSVPRVPRLNLASVQADGPEAPRQRPVRVAQRTNALPIDSTMPPAMPTGQHSLRVSPSSPEPAMSSTAECSETDQQVNCAGFPKQKRF